MAAPSRKETPSRAVPVRAAAPKTPASAQLTSPRRPSATTTGTASGLATQASSPAKPADGQVVLIDVPEGGGARSKRPSVTFGSPVVFSSGSGVTTSEKAKKQQQKLHRSINRPSELPMLRMPKFLQPWNPLRIIGLLRPGREKDTRHEPTLRELLIEAQSKEQARVNLYTKEYQRHVTVIVVVALLFLYYVGVTSAYLYYELRERTPATPGPQTIPWELLRSTVNGRTTHSSRP